MEDKEELEEEEKSLTLNSGLPSLAIVSML